MLRALERILRMKFCAALRVFDVLADDIALEQRRFAVRGFDKQHRHLAER